MHKGVGLIIRNELGTHFFIQEKDEQYHTEKYRNCFSLWGGAIEKGETVLEAVVREAKEEISLADYSFLAEIKQKETSFLGDEDHKFYFTLFESIVSESEFTKITDSQILEGRGKVVHFDELLKIKWVWGLDKAVKSYIESSLNTG